jgi:hypothetical protein
MASILSDDYQPHNDFARDNHCHPRPLARYRNEPDGLPFVRFAGKIYIHVPAAREWLEARVHHLNPRRA